MDNVSALNGVKKIIQQGLKENITYLDGTKVTFHYVTRKCDENQTVLDDSRKSSKPFELILGKQFKLDAWENCVKTMQPKEIASFKLPPSKVAAYPLVAKSLRDIERGKIDTGHSCCGSMNAGLGYDDLDDLMKNPQPLEFIIELLKVEVPGSYKKEVWIMSDDEKLIEVPKLKEEGNKLYNEKMIKEAGEKYAKAIGILEQLLLREKPGDEPHNKLRSQKFPILLNYAQCKLKEKDFYQVIEHTSEVIKYDPDNVKALYRRGVAHKEVWNINEAREDFSRVLELDCSLKAAIKKQMDCIDLLEKQQDEKDKDKYKGKLFS